MSRRPSPRNRGGRVIGGASPAVTPLTIFPGAVMLWLDGYGGTYLRDAGGNVPDNAEAVATAIDRGTVGNCTAGAGVTYSSSAFGGRGAMSFPASTAAKLTSPSWAPGAYVVGGAVWAPAADFGTCYQHGAVNTHSALFVATHLLGRRSNGGAFVDTTVTSPTLGISRRSVWAFSTDEGVLEDTEGSATNGTDRSLGAGSQPTYIGGLDVAAYPMSGPIGEVFLAALASAPSAAQLAQVHAYLLAKWGV